MPPHRIAAARIAEPAQLLEDARQRQPLAARLCSVRRKPLCASTSRLGPSFGCGWAVRSLANAVAPDRITLRTTFREIFSSQLIALSA
jgi:hypothetical protein